MIEALAANCRKLSNLSIGDPDATITSSMLVKLFQASPPLSSLILEAVDGVNDEVVKAIGEHLRGLKRLALNDCKTIQQESTVLFAAYLLRDRLTRFSLAYLGFTRLQHARSLVLKNCSFDEFFENEHD